MQNPKYLNASFCLSSFTTTTSFIQFIKAHYNIIQIVSALWNNWLFNFLPVTYFHEKINNIFKISVPTNKKRIHKRRKVLDQQN